MTYAPCNYPSRLAYPYEQRASSIGSAYAFCSTLAKWPILKLMNESPSSALMMASASDKQVEDVADP